MGSRHGEWARVARPRSTSALFAQDYPPAVSALEAGFIAPQILARDDIAERQARLASLVSGEIIPRLMAIHFDGIANAEPESHPTEAEISELAHLVLSPDTLAAAAYVEALRTRGLSMDMLFVELLEPAARHLGYMWETDECDFIDVTLGVGRLQRLLSVFNCTHDHPAINERRRVLMATLMGEQHSFGVQMVEKFLEAGGWDLVSQTEATPTRLAAIVRDNWYPVAGFTLSCESRLPLLTKAIAEVRRASRNPWIGIMVGGPVFTADPDLVNQVGADSTAASAPTAVILAQKLFDISVTTGVTHKAANS